MKSIRTLVAGLGLLALLPMAASAQDNRNFDNSWFWGAKGGVMTFWTTRVNHAPAPEAGLEWLITRHRGGLLLGLSQGWFTEKSSIFDPSAVNQDRTVDMKNERRFEMSLVGFPHQWGAIRPYVGVGMSFAQILSATGEGVTAGTTLADSVASSIEKVRTATMPQLLVGGQTQVGRFAVFGQAVMLFPQKSFLFNNNQAYAVEGGIRYNFGSSIDRPN